MRSAHLVCGEIFTTIRFLENETRGVHVVPLLFAMSRSSGITPSFPKDREYTASTLYA